MKYGHLLNNQVIYATYPLRVGNTDYFFPDSDIALQAGEKEIIDTVKPSDTYKGKYVMSWTENETQIVRTWTFVEYTDKDKENRYNVLTVAYIRKQYSANDENKILREYLANGESHKEAFDTYNSYVEGCKAAAYAEAYESE